MKRGLRRERKSEIKEELGRSGKRFYIRVKMGDIKEELRKDRERVVLGGKKTRR